MSTFTTRLSTIEANGFDLGMGPNDYEIFDETHRSVLNRKIFDHYANYEIGQETQEMFKFALNRKMREIMPYYNKLYLTERIEFDPLQTVNYRDTTATTSNSESESEVSQSGETASTDSGATESTNETAGKSRSVGSNTPQVMLSPNEDYASNIADAVSESTVESSAESSSTSNATSNASTDATQRGEESSTINREVTGSQGVASELLMLYRASLINVDMQIIDELKTLFMQIWDNGDEYTPHGMNGRYGYGNGFWIL